MSNSTRSGSVDVGLALGMLIALAGLNGGRACAEPFNLRDALFGKHAQDRSGEFAVPGVARYEVDPGEAFTFDRLTGGEALLKFDNDPEIWVLTSTAGPRGDVIYKNDTGAPVVRATRLGGLTLFTPNRPDGMAAAFLGQAPPPRASHVIGPEGLQLIAIQASERASRAAQHLVEFDAPDVNPASEMVFADAFFVTAQAFVHVSQRGRSGLQTLSRVVDVRFLSGPGPSALVRGPMVEITVAPQLGVAGRPSSQRIAEVICPR